MEFTSYVQQIIL